MKIRFDVPALKREAYASTFSALIP
jgi:hypothetical protein